MTKFTGWDRVRIWHLTQALLFFKRRERFSLEIPKISNGDARMKSAGNSEGHSYTLSIYASCFRKETRAVLG